MKNRADVSFYGIMNSGENQLFLVSLKQNARGVTSFFISLRCVLKVIDRNEEEIDLKFYLRFKKWGTTDEERRNHPLCEASDEGI